MPGGENGQRQQRGSVRQAPRDSGVRAFEIPNRFPDSVGVPSALRHLGVFVKAKGNLKKRDRHRNLRSAKPAQRFVEPVSF